VETVGRRQSRLYRVYRDIRLRRPVNRRAVDAAGVQFISRRFNYRRAVDKLQKAARWQEEREELLISYRRLFNSR
jgi:hypothetical protein